MKEEREGEGGQSKRVSHYFARLAKVSIQYHCSISKTYIMHI